MNLIFLKKQHKKAIEYESQRKSSNQKVLDEKNRKLNLVLNFFTFSSKSCFNARQIATKCKIRFKFLNKNLTEKHHCFLKRKTDKYLRVLLKHKTPFGKIKLKTKLTTRELWIALKKKPLEYSDEERFLKLSRGCLSSTQIYKEVFGFFPSKIDKNKKHLLELKRQRYIQLLTRKGCDHNTIKQIFIVRGSTIKTNELY